MHQTSPNTTTPATENEPAGQKESCRSCLYMGVGTCTGLAGYFILLALEDEGETSRSLKHETSKNMRLQKPQILPKLAVTSSLQNLFRGSVPPNKNRPFLLGFSACWAAAGLYRLYLN